MGTEWDQEVVGKVDPQKRVLCGRYTEWENLAETLEKILLIREAGNVAYLLQDKEKMQEIEGLAGLIGWMAGGNPAVTKVVEIGLVGAWAYMESILDVRSLSFRLSFAVCPICFGNAIVPVDRR